MLFNQQLIKRYIKQENTIRNLHRTTHQLLEYAYISSHVGNTYLILFIRIIDTTQEKKAYPLYNPFSYSIHIHRYVWLCQYAYHP